MTEGTDALPDSHARLRSIKSLSGLGSHLISNLDQGIRQIPVSVMAYMGDSVFEVIARLHSINTTEWKMRKLHNASVLLVKAEAQASLLHEAEQYLTTEESDIVRRGRNGKAGQIPKGVSAATYRYSTAFETLIGYLFLTDQHERINELLCLTGFADNR